MTFLEEIEKAKMEMMDKKIYVVQLITEDISCQIFSKAFENKLKEKIIKDIKCCAKETVIRVKFEECNSSFEVSLCDGWRTDYPKRGCQAVYDGIPLEDIKTPVIDRILVMLRDKLTSLGLKYYEDLNTTWREPSYQIHILL